VYRSVDPASRTPTKKFLIARRLEIMVAFHAIASIAANGSTTDNIQN
jgi:hypothetical protein